MARNRRVSNMHASNLKNLTSNVAPPACLDLKSRFVFTFSGIFFSLPTRLDSFPFLRLEKVRIYVVPISRSSQRS